MLVRVLWAPGAQALKRPEALRMGHPRGEASVGMRKDTCSCSMYREYSHVLYMYSVTYPHKIKVWDQLHGGGVYPKCILVYPSSAAV